jgi:hypothetical protein
VGVEKLASEKCRKNKTRQEAPQTIFSSRLDIFTLLNSPHFKKKGLFQQPRLLSPTIPGFHQPSSVSIDYFRFARQEFPVRGW